MPHTTSYRVFPRSPEHKTVNLSRDERKNVNGLSGCLAVVCCGLISLVFVLSWPGIARVLREANLVESPARFESTTGIVILVTTAVLFTVVISFLIKYAKISALERKRSKAANEQERQRVIQEAETSTSNVKRIYESSIQCANKLPTCLDNAMGYLRFAEQEYKATAFESFWDSLENAAVALADFNQNANQIGRNASEYYRSLNGRSHTFPSFPVGTQSIPDPLFLVGELRRIKRLGETNFQFANILAHRKTRRVMSDGLRRLNDAINDLGYTIENSMSDLRDSISSDMARLVEEQIRTRESVDTEAELIEQGRQTIAEQGSNIDKRLLEQNRMLDNLQHHRKPKLGDIPSKR